MFMDKVFYIILIYFCLSGCRHREQDVEVSSLQKLQDKRNFYCSQDIDVYKQVDRCDGLTFIGLYDAYCKQVDIWKHEYEVTYRIEGSTEPHTKADLEKVQYGTGKWNRDILPCYDFDVEGSGTGNSRSGISFESQLGAMHSIWARKDHAAAKRMLDYAVSHDWILSEGPEEYTKLNELSFLMKKIVSSLEGNGLVEQSSEDATATDSILDKLKGYRGKVIADYISLKGKVYGYLNAYEMELLKLSIDKDPDNPIYKILMGKYEDGHQDDIDFAVGKLLDETVYPSDKLPGHLDQIDWGDNLGQAIYAWMVSDLE